MGVFVYEKGLTVHNDLALEQVQKANRMAVNSCYAAFCRIFFLTDEKTAEDIEQDFEDLELQLARLDYSDPNPTGLHGLSTALAIELIESAFFEIRIVAKPSGKPWKRGDVWQPLEESYIEFRKRHAQDKINCYVDEVSDPGFPEVKLWVDGFFK